MEKRFSIVGVLGLIGVAQAQVPIRIEGTTQTTQYFSPSTGVTGVNASENALAASKIDVPASPPECDEDGFDSLCADADVNIGFGSAAAECPGGAGDASTTSVPSEGGGNDIEVSAIYQNRILCWPPEAASECGLLATKDHANRVPPGPFFQDGVNGFAGASYSASYQLTEPTMLVTIITAYADVYLLPACACPFICTPPLNVEATRSTDDLIFTVQHCSATGSGLLWARHSSSGSTHSGEFTISTQSIPGGTRRIASATINSSIAAGTVNLSPETETFTAESHGDGDRDNDRDRCDLVLLRCLTVAGAQQVCSTDYNVRLDLDLDGDLDSADEAALIVLLPPVPGDATGDWEVSFADITMVLTNWGQMGVGQFGGDVNLDGVVNFADITFIFVHYNKGVPNADPECPACP